MKKLTKQQVEYLFAPKALTWREKYLTDFYYKPHPNSIILVRAVKKPLFIILYIPSAIIDLITAIWDGGLKYYELPKRDSYSYLEYFDWDERVGKLVKAILAEQN